MKVTALKNFSANGVVGFPGKVLSDEELDQIENIFDEMMSEGLISVEDMDSDNSSEEDEIAEELIEEEPAPQPKSKKKK